MIRYELSSYSSLVEDLGLPDCFVDSLDSNERACRSSWLHLRPVRGPDDQAIRSVERYGSLNRTSVNTNQIFASLSYRIVTNILELQAQDFLSLSAVLRIGYLIRRGGNSTLTPVGDLFQSIGIPARNVLLFELIIPL